MDINLALIRFLSFLVAGKEAEQKYLSDQDLEIDDATLTKTASIDFDFVNEKLQLLKETGQGLQIDLHCLTQHVGDYLNRPEVWICVQGLASELLKVAELHDLEADDYNLLPFNPLSR